MSSIKRVITVLLISVLFVSLSVVCTAHPGRTDSKGGHWDSYAHEYHYHHGHPAHQHKDGKCPYDFDDQTEHSSQDAYKNSSGSVSLSDDKAKKHTSYWQIIENETVLELNIMISFAVVWYTCVPILNKLEDVFNIRFTQGQNALIFLLYLAICVMLINTIVYVIILMKT